ncbi:type II toxin-antitoxin system Phd/YefM family antitoxin [Jannaschia donghaensis]|uniref:Antitoxin n=1 Tax=Jannaschia donghaensis TaxID=420998 RepID=A0A0M6YEF0_9RHOB|nr:type II toxin-antitoxin system prevent-host-death family antitoxin [Jannaschia donghaensis]CTQ48075.1 VapB-mt4 [Jannaschia donghaensis]
MTAQVPVAEAKKTFADLIRRAEAGEEIELTRYGRPVARLVATKPVPKRSIVGLMVGKGVSPADPWAGDAEIQEMFEESLDSKDNPLNW